MFLLFIPSFLSWIQQKKSRGTDIFGLCFVLNMTQCVLCCWKNYIQMLNLRMHVYTVYGTKIRLRLVQLNLVSLGTKRMKEVEKYSQRLPCCVNCLVACGSKAAGLRQFSKVRSSKRDFVDRCKFHCCCTLLQLCMLPYRNLSFMRTVE